MIIILIFLIGVIITMSLFLLEILNVLKSINKQIELKIGVDTNFIITSDLHLKGLKRLCSNLNLMYSKYSYASLRKRESEKEFKEMLSYIAHDVRTPLTSVEGYIELLEENDTNFKNERYYKIINTRLKDVENILEKFFLYAKLINDDYKIENTKCNVYEVCCQSVLNFYSEIIAKGINPEIEFDKRDIEIYANKEMLMKLFDNLISNAIKHGNGDLKIVLEKNEIRISNTIKNPSKIEIDKIFNRFYKGDESRSNISSGLGLTIAKKIVSLVNGEIEAIISENIFSINIILNNITLNKNDSK